MVSVAGFEPAAPPFRGEYSDLTELHGVSRSRGWRSVRDLNPLLRIDNPLP